MTYVEELLDPKWIRNRMRILRRDGFKCTVCGSKDNLCVHHTFYYRHRVKPWEYPSSSLMTLCETCHRDYHLHHENTIRNNPKPRKPKKLKPVVKKTKAPLWAVEVSRTPYKGNGIRYVRARDKAEAVSLIKRQGVPIFHISKLD